MIQQFYLCVYVQKLLHHLDLEEIPVRQSPHAFSAGDRIQCLLETTNTAKAGICCFFLNALQYCCTVAELISPFTQNLLSSIVLVGKQCKGRAMEAREVAWWVIVHCMGIRTRAWIPGPHRKNWAQQLPLSQTGRRRKENLRTP